jgi:fatty-acyl-CoA synthase
MQVETLEDIHRIEATGPWRPPVASTYELLHRSAARNAGDALLCPADEELQLPARALRYPDLLRRVTQLANALHRQGVGRRDVVSLLQPDSIELHVALWAVQAVGIAHPVDAALSPRAVVAALRAARTVVLLLSAAVATTGFIELLRRSVPSLRTIMVCGAVNAPSSACLDLDRLVETEPEQLAPAIELPRPDDVCVLLPTGSMGALSRLARLSHGNLVCAATTLAALAVLDSNSVLLCTQPLSHVSGVILGGLLPLQVGARVVVAATNARRARSRLAGGWEPVKRHGVTTLFATPAVLGKLVHAPTDRGQVASLRHILCGGAGLSPGLARRVEALTGAQVLQGYGLTEATCVSAFSPSDVARTSGSVGLRLPFQQLRCVRPDADGWREVPAGVIGHVHVQGPNVFAGYVDARLDAQVMLEGGWLATGDYGFLDEAGQLHLIGRHKDVIIRDGHKIEASQIERALALHPDVATAAAVACPDVRSGEVPIAYVVLQVGAASSAEMLLAHCTIALRDPLAIPVQLRLLPTLPITSAGKVDKVALRRIEAMRAVREALQGAGISVSVAVDPEAGEAVQLVIENIPRGRRPTVVRVMEQFSIAWRYGGGKTGQGTSP